MRFPVSLNFYGNHSLNFENNDIDELEYFTITELRKIAIPEKILQMEYNALLLMSLRHDCSRAFKIDNWYPISINDSEVRKFPKDNVVTFGPMAMRIVINPTHITLPSSLYEPVEWYSPENKEKVQAWRSYYKTIITHFGGDHVLYVDERKTDKYFHTKVKPNEYALEAFEQTLISKYGKTKKSLFDYPQGKFPKYYIDYFGE